MASRYLFRAVEDPADDEARAGMLLAASRAGVGFGYKREDIPALVCGALPQHRVTKLSPRPAGAEELARIFEEALVAWQGVRMEES